MMRTRRWWMRVHRYIGLSAGLLLVLLGLTGSVITYQQELDARLHPDLLKVRSPGPWMPLDRMEARARAAMPAGAVLRWARMPHADDGAVSWFFADARGQSWETTIDPVTLQVLGRRESDAHLLAWIYEFHATLLMGLAGNVALAVEAIAVLCLIGAGLWLWWPRRRHHWHQALRVKLGSSPARLHFDLHRVTGAYVAPLLIVSGFTGIYMALPPLMNGAVSLLSPVTPHEAPRGSAGPVRLTLDEAVRLARQVYPGTSPKVLVLPTEGVYEINLSRPGDRLSRKTGEWTVFIDAATGKVLRKVGPEGGSGGDRFIRWMFPLHNGEAFGEAGRAVVCAVGLVPVLLAITGWSIWLRRRRTHPARAAERPACQVGRGPLRE